MVTLEATAPTWPLLLALTGKNLLAHLVYVPDVMPALRERIVLEATSPSQLAQRWIETLLTLARDQHYLFLDFPSITTDIVEGVWRLNAFAVGELVDPLRHTFLQPLHTVQIKTCTVSETNGLLRLTCDLKVS